jgi:hypothetical protein
MSQSSENRPGSGPALKAGKPIRQYLVLVFQLRVHSPEIEACLADLFVENVSVAGSSTTSTRGTYRVSGKDAHGF